MASNHINGDTSAESDDTNDVTEHFNDNNHRDKGERSASGDEYAEHTIFVTTETVSDSSTKEEDGKVESDDEVSGRSSGVRE